MTTEPTTPFTGLQPILYVSDLETEKRFYSQLGFTVKDEMKDFASVRQGEGIMFGLLLKKDFRLVNFNQPLVWQIGVNSVQQVCAIVEREGLKIEQMPALEVSGEWTMSVASPNGWLVFFEGGE